MIVRGNRSKGYKGTEVFDNYQLKENVGKPENLEVQKEQEEQVMRMRS